MGLSVSIKELPDIQVAYLHCDVNMAAGNFSQQIGNTFNEVKAWARERGYTP
jgi:DNA gyrase inhibitor GyrI